jgi:hypothetical protein
VTHTESPALPFRLSVFRLSCPTACWKERVGGAGRRQVIFQPWCGQVEGGTQASPHLDPLALAAAGEPGAGGARRGGGAQAHASLLGRGGQPIQYHWTQGKEGV